MANNSELFDGQIKQSEYLLYAPKKEKLDEALKIALDTRKFEIEMYWKRANYFWAFVSVVFIGWYTTLGKEDLFVSFLLLFLGLFVSFAWYCANRGSKFWQENWERHIRYLTEHMGMPIFEIITQYDKNFFNLMSKYPYSVSKVNQMVSLVITAFWILLLGKELFCIIYDKLTCLNSVCQTIVAFFTVIMAIIVVLLIIYFVVHRHLKSFVLDPKQNGIGKEMFYFHP